MVGAAALVVVVLALSDTGRGSVAPPSPIGTTSPSPPPTFPDYALNGVTCLSASDCWAVGVSSSVNGTTQPLIEHYAGSSWAMVSTPKSNPGSLSGVTCLSAADCWAVGGSANFPPSQPLIEHYAGSSWAIVSTPSPSPGGGLTAVTCVSAGDCWAVGFSISGNGPGEPLIEHYAGSRWAIVNSPNPSPG
jgi:hypothetical protein